MDLNNLKKAVAIKAKNTAKRFKGAAKSYVSLFIVLTLIVGGTTAWMASKDKINVTSPNMDFNSSSGMHNNQMQPLQKDILIPNFRLEEASSVDGRNIYFPSSMWNNSSDKNYAGNNTLDSVTVDTVKAAKSSDTLVDWTATNTKMQAQTIDLRFREGNAGDKNVRYAYGDCDINSVGGKTNVWLKGYKIVIGPQASIENQSEENCYVYHDQIDMIYQTDNEGKPIKPTSQTFTDPYTCPVRIAIIDDSGHTPKIFDPSAKLADYVEKTYAVKYIDNEGNPTLQETTNLESFSSYYYGTNNPLFTIDKGHSINMTVVAWLEGTHPYAKNFIGQYMTIALEIETNVTQMDDIYVHDWTIGDNYEDGGRTSPDETNYIPAANGDGGQWFDGNVNIAMSYYDQFADTYKTTVLTKLTSSNVTAVDRANGINADGTDSQGRKVFKASMPNYVTSNISFYRLSKHSDDVFPGTVFNSWHTYEGVNADLNDAINSNPNNGGSKMTAQWRILGNLTDTREVKGSTDCYIHYYPLRGNGYGYVDHDANDRYTKWLSPGIGYWGVSTGPVKVTAS